MTPEKQAPSLDARSAPEWRKWLEQNHYTESRVWLIFYHKSSDKADLTYNEAVDEALCFGWIDSVPKKRDAQSSYRLFSRRNPKSFWSRINKDKVERLTRNGKMMPAGQAVVAAAQATGAWDALNEVEALIVPDDLQMALEAVPVALENWEKFPPSSQKIILTWIHSAKRETTRSKRISEVVSLAQRNIRANHYRQPNSSN